MWSSNHVVVPLAYRVSFAGAADQDVGAGAAVQLNGEGRQMEAEVVLASNQPPDAGSWAGSCIVAVQEAKAYPRAMPNCVSAAIDRRLEDLIVACARRRWPPLRLVPARWIRPAVAPVALRVRRLLSRAVLAAAPIAIILGLLILTP